MGLRVANYPIYVIMVKQLKQTKTSVLMKPWEFTIHGGRRVRVTGKCKLSQLSDSSTQMVLEHCKDGAGSWKSLNFIWPLGDGTVGLRKQKKRMGNE